MKFNKLISSTIVLIAFLLSTQVNAFKVDQMIIISDKKGNGVITLYNDEARPIFINSEIQELKIEGDKIIKIKYNRSNLDDWKISITTPKLVLKKGESKSVGIRSLCYNITCDDSRDLMFLLPFYPSSYRTEGEEQKGIEINYGFAPMYIIPTTKPKFDYDIKNEGDSLVVMNNSNTMINLFINSCTSENTVGCRQKYIVIAGRKKVFTLSKSLQSQRLDVMVTSHDRSYKRKEVVIWSGL